MAFHVIFLLIWLATAMDYTDSSLVARVKLCRLLLQLRDEAKWLPRLSMDEFLIRMFKVLTYWKQHTYYLPVFNIVIKNSSEEGCGSRFVLFLDRSKSLHSFAFTRLATSNESYAVFSMLFKFQCVCTFHTWTGNSILSTHITCPKRGVAAVSVHYSTEVRANTVFPSPQAINQCSPWL